MHIVFYIHFPWQGCYFLFCFFSHQQQFQGISIFLIICCSYPLLLLGIAIKRVNKHQKLINDIFNQLVDLIIERMFGVIMSRVIETERLILRTWNENDLQPMLAINQDPEVMEYFPGLQDLEMTNRLIDKKMLITVHGILFICR